MFRMQTKLCKISTHALREEGDMIAANNICAVARFLPTPSARRATLSAWCQPPGQQFLPTPSARRATFRMLCWLLITLAISTHALREEGDC